MDFYEAWHYLSNHPYFKMHGRPELSFLLDISVMKVNPHTRHVDDDRTRNTMTEVWIETGQWLTRDTVDSDEKEHIPEHGIRSHDWELDCGGTTFEEAIIQLAQLMRKRDAEASDIKEEPK